jgi:hypothetical protein
MKRGYKFYFQDEPQFASYVFNRQYLANKFRAYRAHPKRYQFTKTESGYQVTTTGYTAIGIYQKF